MGQKSRFLDFFKVVLELFRKCLGYVFGLKGPRNKLFCKFIKAKMPPPSKRRKRLLANLAQRKRKQEKFTTPNSE